MTTLYLMIIKPCLKIAHIPTKNSIKQCKQRGQIAKFTTSYSIICLKYDHIVQFERRMAHKAIPMNPTKEPKIQLLQPGFMYSQRDTKQRYTQISQTLANYLGFDNWQDVIGRTVLDFDHPRIHQFNAKFHQQNRRLVDSNTPSYFFNIQFFCGNIVKTTINQKVPILSNDNKVLGFESKYSDVSALYNIPGFVRRLNYFSRQANASGAVQNHSFQIIDKYSFNNLTEAESAIIFLLSFGLTSRSIALDLNNSVRTVECHLANLKEKLQLHSKEQLVEFAHFSNFNRSIPFKIFFSKKNIIRLFNPAR